MKRQRKRSPKQEERLKVLTEEEALIQAVGTLISEAMQAQGMNNAKVAERLGTSRPNVTQLLRGDRNLSLRTLARLAYALGIRVKVNFEALKQPQVLKEQWTQNLDSPEWRQKLRMVNS